MPLLPALVLFAAASAGGLLGPRLERRRDLHAIGLAFAIGTLLTVVVAHVLPETFAHLDGAPLLVVAGYAGMLLLHQRVLRVDPCCDLHHARHAGIPSFLALALCSLNDGIVLAVDHERGLASPLLWGMALHEATAAFALLLLLREAVGDGRYGLKLAYVVAFALVAPLAMLTASHLEHRVAWIPVVMAISAGALLYVVSSNLVPRIEHEAGEQRGKVVIAFVVAVALNLALEGLHPHQHGH
jgi:zinc transporter ZupT